MTRDLLENRFREEGINIKTETLRRGFDGITGLGPFPTEFELYVDNNQLELARSIFKNWLDLPGKEDPIWLESIEVLQSWADDPDTYGELAAASAAKLLEIDRL